MARSKLVAEGAGAGAVALVVAWFALRAGWQAPSTLWLDDAWLALVTKADGVVDAARVGVTAPGFALLLDGVHAVTGAVEGLVRVALVSALLAPVVVYVAARTGFALAPIPALVAGVTTAAAPVLVDYATRVKPFTIDVVLAAAVLGVAASVLREPERQRRWWALAGIAVGAVAVSAAVASTVVGAFLVTGVGALRRGLVRTAALPVLTAGLLGAAWWLFVIRPATNEGLRRYWDDFHTLAKAPDAAEALLPFGGTVALLVLAVAAVVAVARRPTPAALAVAPVVVAVAVALVGLQPLGGGRTDAHLLPALALLIALAVDALPSRAVAAAAVSVALVVAAPSAAPYPEEDLGPLVAAYDAGALGDDDAPLLVYSSARWAWALETTEPIALVDSETEANGFDVAALDPGTRILPRLRDEPERYPEAVETAAGDATSIWLLVSHPGPDLDALHAALAAEGFARGETIARPGAELSRWARSAEAATR